MNKLIEFIFGIRKRGDNALPKGIYQTTVPWEYSFYNPDAVKWKEELTYQNRGGVIYLEPIKEDICQ